MNVKRIPFLAVIAIVLAGVILFAAPAQAASFEPYKVIHGNSWTVAAQAQAAVEIPGELENLIAYGIEILVVFVLTQISKWGLDLTGYKAQVTAAIAGAIVVIANALLANVPVNLEAIVTGLLNLIVIVLAAFGFYKQVYRGFFPLKPKG